MVPGEAVAGVELTAWPQGEEAEQEEIPLMAVLAARRLAQAGAVAAYFDS